MISESMRQAASGGDGDVAPKTLRKAARCQVCMVSTVLTTDRNTCRVGRDASRRALFCRDAGATHGKPRLGMGCRHVGAGHCGTWGGPPATTSLARPSPAPHVPLSFRACPRTPAWLPRRTSSCVPTMARFTSNPRRPKTTGGAMTIRIPARLKPTAMHDQIALWQRLFMAAGE